MLTFVDFKLGADGNSLQEGLFENQGLIHCLVPFNPRISSRREDATLL